VSARLYTPEAARSRSPLLLYVHGGGFVAGDLDTHDNLIRMIAAEAGLRVMAVDYRRPPEHVYPAALDDAHAAYTFAVANADALDIDPRNIAIGGESAGGAHCVSLALRLRADGVAQPAALWLLVPALDASRSGNSYRDFATGAGRTADEFGFLWSLYLPTSELLSDRQASPLAADLAGLPPVLVFTAEFDPARDDGEAFVAKAKAAGITAVLKRCTGLIHQFPEIVGISAASRQAVIDAAGDLKRLLG
jgi:acetyl esterase